MYICSFKWQALYACLCEWINEKHIVKHFIDEVKNNHHIAILLMAYITTNSKLHSTSWGPHQRAFQTQLKCQRSSTTGFANMSSSSNNHQNILLWSTGTWHDFWTQTDSGEYSTTEMRNSRRGLSSPIHNLRVIHNLFALCRIKSTILLQSVRAIECRQR